MTYHARSELGARCSLGLTPVKALCEYVRSIGAQQEYEEATNQLLVSIHFNSRDVISYDFFSRSSSSLPVRSLDHQLRRDRCAIRPSERLQCKGYQQTMRPYVLARIVNHQCWE